MASRNIWKKRETLGAALVASKLPSAHNTTGRCWSRRDQGKEASFLCRSIDASTKNASRTLCLGKSSSSGQKTSSGSNRRGHVYRKIDLVAWETTIARKRLKLSGNVPGAVPKPA